MTDKQPALDALKARQRRHLKELMQFETFVPPYMMAREHIRKAELAIRADECRKLENTIRQAYKKGTTDEQ